MPKLLIIEDDVSFSQMLERFLSRKGFEVTACSSAVQAKKFFTEENYDFILTDLRLPENDGISLLDEIKAVSPTTEVVVMTGYAEVQTAVSAMKKGAKDYVSKPFSPDELLAVLAPQSSKKSNPDVRTPASSPKLNSTSVRPVSGVSDASKKLQKYLDLVAPTELSVLITGESGTGKEIAAKIIHEKSKRRENTFIAVDCGAIPRELAPSEFFGHIKGSFTGAIDDKKGQFEAAHTGTLFLDEIGNLSYENQMHLLRALQEKKIKKVGGTREIEVDVRIIAATNEDLSQRVSEGKFREDLYHRLNQFYIEIPSLRDREEDILLFAHHFLERANRELDKDVTGFEAETEDLLTRYAWPGNLREMQNVIRRAVLLNDSTLLQAETLPQEFRSPAVSERNSNLSLESMEKERILHALKKTNFNKSEAAKLLKVSRKTLYNRLNQYNLME